MRPTQAIPVELKNEQNCSLDGKARHALRSRRKAITDIAQSSLGKRPAWNLIADRNVSRWSAVLSFEIAHASIGVPMNIFYIIGVIVVVLFVAGFFGLHV
jgi:hypothetical protein